MRIRERAVTTREDAFSCSYTQKAEPKSGKIDMQETNAGGLAVAVLSEGGVSGIER